MDEEKEDSKDDSSSRDDKPPMVNGMAVPIREGPGRSARPGKRVQPMDTSDEFDMNGNGPVDGMLQVRQTAVTSKMLMTWHKSKSCSRGP